MNVFDLDLMAIKQIIAVNDIKDEIEKTIYQFLKTNYNDGLVVEGDFFVKVSSSDNEMNYKKLSLFWASANEEKGQVVFMGNDSDKNIYEFTFNDFIPIAWTWSLLLKTIMEDEL